MPIGNFNAQVDAFTQELQRQLNGTLQAAGKQMHTLIGDRLPTIPGELEPPGISTRTLRT
jgi:hypothetical protein